MLDGASCTASLKSLSPDASATHNALLSDGTWTATSYYVEKLMF